MGTGGRGFDRASMFIPMSTNAAFNLYAFDALPHLVINYEATKWEGRIEDRAITNGGIKISAYGYWRALHDTRYTALWSDTSTRRWETVISNSAFTPERYQIDFNNRLYIAPRGGEQISSSQRGVVGYRIPDKSTRDIEEVEFTYNFLAPNSTWQMIFNRGNSSFTGGVNELTVNGTGSLITATVTQTLGAPAASVLFAIKYNSGTATTITNTGDVYLKITGIRVKTKTGTIYANDIIEDMISVIDSGQLSASTAMIQSPAVDLEDVIFEDKRPADILADLEYRGDSNSPPRVWTSAVFDGQMLQFQPIGDENGRHWYVDVPAIDLQKTIDALSTTIYTKYVDENGRTLRTDTASNAQSIVKNGIDRTYAARANTTSETQAELIRDAELDERGETRPRAAVIVTKLYNASGGGVPLIEARSGDRLTIRNLPNIGAELDNIQTFTIDRTRLAGGELEIVPSRELPNIADLLAQSLV